MVVTVSEEQRAKVLHGDMWHLCFDGAAPKQLEISSRHYISTNGRDSSKKFARILVLDRRPAQLRDVTKAIAKANGFASHAEFQKAWLEKGRAWDPQGKIELVTFIVIAEKRRNGRWVAHACRIVDASDSASSRRLFDG